jgi:hypothetical protein
MRAVFSLGLRVVFLAGLVFTSVTCGEHHATDGIDGTSPTSPTSPTPPTSPTSPHSPALLQCSTTQAQSSSSLVTPLGGIVHLGGTAVTIPLGALLTATTITLTVPASPVMEIEVKANNLTSFLFQQDVSITIDYSRCSAAEASKAPLSVWHIDTQTKQLLENMGGVDDKTTHRITFTTGHLSGYAVAF